MFLSAALVAMTLAAPPEAPKPFEFKDGDRVVWIGNTLVEREQRYGYWETALIAANADKKITFRNLGWSGDTVHGEARGRFDFNNPDACFKQLVNLTLELKPTVILVSYGTNESFEGKEGLPKFEKGMEKLLDALKPANARVVLMSPIPVENHPTMPDTTSRNGMLLQYSGAIRAVAERRKLPFADLYEPTKKLFDAAKSVADKKPTAELLYPLTTNGMHLTENGYRATAGCVQLALGVHGSFSSGLLNNDKLRLAIVAKNEQFFNKWRPQNETYLFGFRKHEQGKNAKEIVEFDPFIEKAEAEIEKLRKALVK